MSQDPWRSTGDKPVPEAEIIPPSREGDASRFHADMWMSRDRSGMHRIHVARLGPIGLASLVFGIGLFAALVLILLAGALLLWIPVFVLLIAGAVLGALLRKFIRHWR